MSASSAGTSDERLYRMIGCLKRVVLVDVVVVVMVMMTSEMSFGKRMDYLLKYSFGSSIGGRRRKWLFFCSIGRPSCRTARFFFEFAHGNLKVVRLVGIASRWIDLINEQEKNRYNKDIFVP